jgi:hypothetical protein
VAGFEIVVRPNVLPDIRPAPPRTAPTAESSDTGFCVIRGNGGKQVSLSFNRSASTSSSRRVETKRKSDKVRVYQKKDDAGGTTTRGTRESGGTINRENFVDIYVAKQVWMKGANGPSAGNPYNPTGGGFGSVTTEKSLWKFKPVKETDNVEIMQKDVVEESR